MKNQLCLHCILITIFISVLSIVSLAQWEIQNSGTNLNLTSVYFVDNNNGWAVGSEGIILHTDNGGDTWIVQISGIDFDLESVYFINPDTGWIAGGEKEGYPDQGIILRTVNGGIDWIETYSIESFYLNDVYFSDPNNGWAVGEWHYMMWVQSNILHSTDGGETWDEQVIIPWCVFNSIQFVDSLTGWTVGGYINGSSGYPYCQIYNTIDGGNTWNEQINTVEKGPLFDVCFTDSENGWAVGGNRGAVLAPFSTIFHTNDGGNNWDIQNSLTERVLTGVCFTDSLNGWAVGGYTSFGWIPDTCILLHTTNGGEAWNYKYSGLSNVLTSVYFYDQDNGWIVGDSGLIIHTDNGGLTAIEESQIANSNLQIMCYPNPFSDELTITWNLPGSAYTKIEIWNSTGEKIKELFSKLLSEGKHVYNWKLNDLPSGIYFIRLQIGNEIITKKIIKL